MSYRLVAQIVLVIVSFVVIFTFIKPNLVRLQAIQVETQKYQSVVESANMVNAKITSLLNEINTISQVDLQKLERYLPFEIDQVAISRDIETIIIRNGLTPVILDSAEAEEGTDAPVRRIQQVPEEGGEADGPADSTQERLSSHTFSLGVSGSYASFLSFLRDLERNAYPLRVISLQITAPADESEGFTFTMELETFYYEVN